MHCPTQRTGSTLDAKRVMREAQDRHLPKGSTGNIFWPGVVTTVHEKLEWNSFATTSNRLEGTMCCRWRAHHCATASYVIACRRLACLGGGYATGTAMVSSRGDLLYLRNLHKEINSMCERTRCLLVRSHEEKATTTLSHEGSPAPIYTRAHLACARIRNGRQEILIQPNRIHPTCRVTATTMSNNQGGC